MSVSLKPFNTFHIQAQAAQLVYAQTTQQLVDAWKGANVAGQPALILGEGSNVLFLEDFSGTVILNRISGIDIHEDENAWRLHVGAGENWHQLVEYTLARGIAGLENLAMIPGCTGAAPVQNIGAYGVELSQVCEYVDCVALATGEVHRLSTQACQFGYRDSIFKHSYQDSYAIVGVGLYLSKVWRPVLTYGDLTLLDASNTTPRQVFDTVCHMRTTKLPNPATIGNAGSFFKNPVIDARQAEDFLHKHASAPHYPQPDGSVKLAAGWLIDRCVLKGFRIGGAAVHCQQALVLINQENATSRDVVSLARHVRHCVGEAFNVWLEPEVRFIGAQGEVSAVETIA
jgi:UDP-N-acetylmuramate dehydrogenase